jgi:hypothetical protein
VPVALSHLGFLMNLSLPTHSGFSNAARRHHAPAGSVRESDCAYVRRLRSLLSLFALYAGALFAVIVFSDGPDIGCILMGIAGHVIYASVKTALVWREAAWFEQVQLRVRKAPLRPALARA